MKSFYVYILTNHSGTLYIGVTSNLAQRLQQHKSKSIPGFTEKYNVNQLIYYEGAGDSMTAINREKQLKGWTRAKKINLIESVNPHWTDLSSDVLAQDIAE